MTQPTELLEVVNRTKGTRKMAKGKKKSRRGRPKGSKNKPKDAQTLYNIYLSKRLSVGKGKRGRPPKNAIKGSTNWLENINILARELEKELVQAIARIKGLSNG